MKTVSRSGAVTIFEDDSIAKIPHLKEMKELAKAMSSPVVIVTFNFSIYQIYMEHLEAQTKWWKKLFARRQPLASFSIRSDVVSVTCHMQEYEDLLAAVFGPLCEKHKVDLFICRKGY